MGEWVDGRMGRREGWETGEMRGSENSKDKISPRLTHSVISKSISCSLPDQQVGATALSPLQETTAGISNYFFIGLNLRVSAIINPSPKRL